MAWPCKFGARVRFVFLFFFLSSVVTRKKTLKGIKTKIIHITKIIFYDHIYPIARTHAHTIADYTVMYIYMKTVAHNSVDRPRVEM